MKPVVKGETMVSYRFKRMDAFAWGQSRGNPVGVIYLNRPQDITETKMLTIAQEFEKFVSAVVFVAPSSLPEVDYHVRCFSVEREISFCGHGLLAAAYDLFSTDQGMRERESVVVKTHAGRVTVLNKIVTENMVALYAPAVQTGIVQVQTDSLCRVLNLPHTALDMRYPLQLLSVGQKVLLVPITSGKACVAAKPEYQGLRGFCLQNNVEGVVLYTADTLQPRYQYRTRSFMPLLGYLEDQASGSANAAVGYALLAANRWTGQQILIEQGTSVQAPNTIAVSYDQVRQRIVFAGRAMTSLSGEYTLYS